MDQQQQVQQSNGRKQKLRRSKVPVDVVVPLFLCVRCQVTPIKPPIYMCNSGHPTCVDCYKASKKDHSCPTLSGSNDRMRSADCSKCRKPLLSRNEALEEVLRSLPIKVCSALTDCRVPLQESKSDQTLQLSLQDPIHLEKLERARQEPADFDVEVDFPRDSLARLSTLTVSPSVALRASHKPVWCPYPCSRLVTCGSIYSHFDTHHRRVMTCSARRGCAYSFTVTLPRHNAETRCKAFFLVRLNDHGDHENTKIVPTEVMKMTKSMQDMARHNVLISTLTLGWLSLGQYENEYGEEEENRALLVWATCLYEYSPVSYTVTAYNALNYIPTLSFTGPLVSLYETQKPQDVFQRGECLVIPVGFLHRLFTDTCPMRLSITFHDDPPVPCSGLVPGPSPGTPSTGTDIS